MIVTGQVTRVNELPARDGKGSLTAVSIEGLSVLVRDGTPVPEVNLTVRANVSVYWPKGDNKRPIHWLGPWEKA